MDLSREQRGKSAAFSASERVRFRLRLANQEKKKPPSQKSGREAGVLFGYGYLKGSFQLGNAIGAKKLSLVGKKIALGTAEGAVWLIAL